MTRPTQQHVVIAVAFTVFSAIGGFIGTSATILAASLTFGDRMWVPRQDFEDKLGSAIKPITDRIGSLETEVALIGQFVGKSQPRYQPVSGARR